MATEGQRSRCRVCNRPIVYHTVTTAYGKQTRWEHTQQRQDAAQRIDDEHLNKGESTQAKPREGTE